MVAPKIPTRTHGAVMGKNSGSRTYDRLGVIPLEDALAAIGQHESFSFLGQTVGTSSLRLQTFKHHGVMCVCCGRKGTHFAVERSLSDAGTDKPYHINMWSKEHEFDDEVLMTCDHILPKSKGGPDVLTNTQTMCGPCNWSKGNKLPGDATIMVGKVKASLEALSKLDAGDAAPITVGELRSLYSAFLTNRKEMASLNKSVKSLKQSNGDLRTHAKRARTEITRIAMAFRDHPRFTEIVCDLPPPTKGHILGATPEQIDGEF